MQELRRILLVVRYITFIVLLAFSSLLGFTQKITTRVPNDLGITDDFNYYIFNLNNEYRISLAVVSAKDTIHICPYITKTPNVSLFRTVVNYEFGHYYNYISHGRGIKTDSLKEEMQTNYSIAYDYWKTSPDLNKIVYKGYDGSSLEKPILINKATNMKEGIAAEYAYIEKELGHRGINWQPLGQYLLPVSSRYYDVIKVENLNTNEIKYFWFDTTKFFGKF